MSFARPNSTIAAGSWTAILAPTIHEAIDDVVPDDGSSFADSSSHLSDSFECGLSSVTDPGVSTGHVMRGRTSTDIPSGTTFTMQLFQGATPITGTVSIDPSVSGIWETFTYTLTGSEADAITNYASLSVKIAVADPLGAADFSVTWFELQVPDVVPPTITQQPEDQYKALGQTGSVSVSATGAGGLTYQWQRSDQGIGAYADIGGATSATYTFTVASTDQRDRFRCNVTDSNGTTTSNSATVTVTFYDGFLFTVPSDANFYDGRLRDPTIPEVGGSITVPLTGVSATGVVGALAVSRSVGLSGISGTGAPGTLAHTATIPITGVSATGNAGFVSIPFGAALTGVSATGAVGSVSTNRTVAITGVSATGVAGSVAPVNARAISGIEAAGTVGGLTANTAVALSGVHATGVIATRRYLLQENGDKILLADGSFLTIENGLTPSGGTTPPIEDIAADTHDGVGGALIVYKRPHKTVHDEIEEYFDLRTPAEAEKVVDAIAASTAALGVDQGARDAVADSLAAKSAISALMDEQLNAELRALLAIAQDEDDAEAVLCMLEVA